MRPGSLASLLALALGAQLDIGLARGAAPSAGVKLTKVRRGAHTNTGIAKIRRAARKRRNILKNRRNHRG